MWLVKHINWKFWRKKLLSTSSVIKILFNLTLFMQNPSNISLPEMTNISPPIIFSPNHFHPSHTVPAQGPLINFFKGATLLSPYIPSPELWVIRPRWTGWSTMLIRVCPRNLLSSQSLLSLWTIESGRRKTGPGPWKDSWTAKMKQIKRNRGRNLIILDEEESWMGKRERKGRTRRRLRSENIPGSSWLTSSKRQPSWKPFYDSWQWVAFLISPMNFLFDVNSTCFALFLGAEVASCEKAEKHSANGIQFCKSQKINEIYIYGNTNFIYTYKNACCILPQIILDIFCPICLLFNIP